MTRTLMYMSALALVPAAFGNAIPSYAITDLGTLGGSNSYAYGINDLGHVTGFSDLSGNPPSGMHAFLYNGQMHDLGALNDIPNNSPQSYSAGSGINNADHVVGSTFGPGGVIPFVWDSAHGMTGLGFPATYGRAINNRGEILIQDSQVPYGQMPEAFLLNPNSVPQLISLLSACSLSSVNAVNDSSTVVGNCVPTGADPQAFAWNSLMGAQALAPGTLESLAWSINDRGQIVGSIVPALGVGRAVESDIHRQMHLLPLIMDAQGNVLNTDAYSISQNGEVVGIASQNAAVWIGSAGYLLDDLITPNSGWHLIQANGVNDSGQIVGYGEIGGQTHAFLLNPVPEPSSFLLLATSGVSLIYGLRRRRRISRKVGEANKHSFLR